MERIEYQGWKDCCRIANDKLELIVTTQVGPRVISIKTPNGQNLFKEYESTLGQTGGDEWNIFGGHRLWHSPEEKPRTYFPDNFPIDVEEYGDTVRFIQPVEQSTFIQKEIDIRLHNDHVHVTHRLRNCGLWPVRLAPWALSVMTTGGTAIVPLPPRDTHENSLLPTSSLAIWPYTNMTDERWHWGEKYLLLRQDADAATPQKVGVHCVSDWCAYAINNQLFLKNFTSQTGAEYPDFNSTVEIFTNNEMLELETLGPLHDLAPGAEVEHVEEWRIFDDVAAPENEEDVEQNILPLARM